MYEFVIPGFVVQGVSQGKTFRVLNSKRFLIDGVRKSRNLM